VSKNRTPHLATIGALDAPHQTLYYYATKKKFSMFLEGRLEMNKGRLEAFSDGVLAVIITVMVLE